MEREKAMKLWKQTNGRATEAVDRKGRSVYKAAYGQERSEFGWEVHHKMPQSKGGTDAFANLEIVHVKTHDEMHNK